MTICLPGAPGCFCTKYGCYPRRNLFSRLLLIAHNIFRLFCCFSQSCHWFYPKFLLRTAVNSFVLAKSCSRINMVPHTARRDQYIQERHVLVKGLFPQNISVMMGAWCAPSILDWGPLTSAGFLLHGGKEMCTTNG